MDRLLILTTLCITSFFFVILEYTYLDFSGSSDRPWVDTSRFKLLSRFSFGDASSTVSRYESRQWKTIDHLTSMVKTLGMQLILIDPDALLKIKAANKKNDLAVGDATTTTPTPFDCQYLCQSHIVLGIEMDPTKVAALQAIIGRLANDLHISFRKVIDTRKNTLEHVQEELTLLSHVFIAGDLVSIQVVLFYKRSNHWWHGLCDDSKEHGREHESIYCRQEHMLSSIGYTQSSIDGLQLHCPSNTNAFLVDLHQSAFVPCNYVNARHFYSNYGFDTSPEAETFRGFAAVLLMQAKSVLDGMGTKFWLSSGTCLGWYRQCGFIPHSKDVDIGIFIKDYNPSMIRLLENTGMKLTHRFGKVEDSFELSFKASNDLKLDIFFFYEERGVIWNGGTQAKTGKKFKYSFPKFSLCLTEFSEAVVRVPCPARPYIEANYGHSWPEMVKDWDWKRSPSNVVENGAWAKSEWDQVIQLLDPPKS